MYSKEELSFILFNNRSVNGVVRNFLPTNIDPYKLISLEDNFEKIKSMYNTSRLIEVNSKELDLTSKDEIVTKEQLEELTDLIIENVGSFNEKEYEYLIKWDDETIGINWPSEVLLLSLKDEVAQSIKEAICFN